MKTVILTFMTCCTLLTHTVWAAQQKEKIEAAQESLAVIFTKAKSLFEQIQQSEEQLRSLALDYKNCLDSSGKVEANKKAYDAIDNNKKGLIYQLAMLGLSQQQLAAINLEQIVEVNQWNKQYVSGYRLIQPNQTN